MRTLLLALVSALCLAIFAFGPALGSQRPAMSPPASPQTLAESLERAYKLINTNQFKQAKAELERAATLAAGPCGECLLGMSYVYQWEKQWDEAIDAAQRAIPLLGTPALQARAYDQLGMVYMVMRTPGALGKSADALRQGASLGGAWGAQASYHLVEVRMMQRQWGEAVQEARRYLQEAGPDATSVKQAHVLLCQSRSYLPEDSPPEATGTEPVRVGQGGVTRPEILFQPKPSFKGGPPARGRVVLETVIDEEGCVQSVRPLKDVPGLTQPAMEALRKWVFWPAMREGTPVRVYYVLTVTVS